MVGGFFDHCSAQWGPVEYEWFERLLDEQDVDIMAWALGTAAPDPAFAGPLMDQMMRLDFIVLPEGLSTQRHCRSL
jgi:antitoxin CptB